MESADHHTAVWLCVDNSSADREIPLATHALRSGKCQEPGIALRVRHLRTCQSDAPPAFAALAIAGQRFSEKRSITLYRDSLSPLSRPTVPLSENMALRCLGMAETEARSQYRIHLAARMRAAREKKGFTFQKMADLLGVKLDAYKKQEKRGALPNYLLDRFAHLVDETSDYIVTGERKKPEPKPRQPATVGRIKRKA